MSRQNLPSLVATCLSIKKLLVIVKDDLQTGVFFTKQDVKILVLFGNLSDDWIFPDQPGALLDRREG